MPAAFINSPLWGQEIAKISISLNQNSLPSSVKLRARYLDTTTTPIGNWSDVVTVQTIP